LREFLTETSESLDTVDNQLVKFEQEPNNAKILDNIFRLVHTIKGTCGFLGLPRLEALAHAGETLMGKFRDGMPVTGQAVTVILSSIDRIKEILAGLEATEAEPEGNDRDLIDKLEAMVEQGMAAMAAGSTAAGSMAGAVTPVADAPPLAPEPPAAAAPAPAKELTTGTLIEQTLERPLRPGEVSLDELERAFRETAIEAPAPAPVAKAEPAAEAPVADAKPAKERAAPKKSIADETASEGDRIANQSIRVNVDTLEHLMTMVSELVLTRNQLLEISRRNEDTEFKVPLQRLSNVTAELQEGVMKTRMQPIGNAWQKLPRIVRDLSSELGKQIELEMHGADTELDRQVLDLIKDPLTHMVRNSADHGLEDTADRAMLGKPEVGKITLAAYHEGGHIIIKIADDGRGLNTDKIRAKVLAQGLATEDELARMSEAQLQKFIFAPGFSTATNVTAVSGRGVGMDVVRTNIELIGGNIDLKSVAGKGTTIIIKIPLTLAIVSALIVEVSGQRFAIPQLSVIELVRAHGESGHRIEMINDTPVLRLRNKLLPLIYLNRMLNLENRRDRDPKAAARDFVVVTQVGSQTFGVVVDSVFHTEEIVVKPMSTMLRNITMFSGNTILGDGSVIMIIDPNGIAAAVANDATVQAVVEELREEERSGVTHDITTLLVFSAGGSEPKAVPLSLVTRLEEIDPAKIEHSNGRTLVQYRGKLMPLVFFDGYDRSCLKTSGGQPVLVFADNDRSMGLVVDKIIDIVEDRLMIEIVSDYPGVFGSAVIKGHATEIIDVGHYLPMAFDDWLERKDRTPAVHVKRDLRLLLVDDSAFFRNMLAPLLMSAGYRVTLAASGEEALELKERGEMFDVIVSDIEMPGMSGIEFAERLHDDDDWSRTPIIALSSHAEQEVIERSRAAGFHDYIGKFDRAGLVQTLREVKSGMEEAR
jgi:two-component system chemotaxis sensor kinase CheA